MYAVTKIQFILILPMIHSFTSSHFASLDRLVMMTLNAHSTLESDTLGYRMVLRKPMGILLEQDESDLSSGVIVKTIDPNGQTAKKMGISKEDSSILCIRDRILAVNGIQCKNESFERVLELIQSSDDHVDLLLGRPFESVVVTWSNGVSIAAKSGEYFGNLANESSFRIPYSCRSGSCGTCEQTMIIDGRTEKQSYIRPCVARVPNIAPRRIHIIPSRRFSHG